MRTKTLFLVITGEAIGHSSLFTPYTNWQPEVGICPNPFSDIVNIEYALEKNATVSLTIFNLYDQEVKILVN